jgi:hypothetical protein
MYSKKSVYKPIILLVESNQSIVNLGIPSVIAGILNEEFKNNAFTVANWFKSYFTVSSGSDDRTKNWFRYVSNSLRSNDRLNLYDYTQLYESTFDVNDYTQMLKKYEMSTDDPVDTFSLFRIRKDLKEEITKLLFSNIFFTAYNLMKDLRSKKLRDINRYKNLSFMDAAVKYDEIEMFVNDKARKIKEYPTGYKWMNAGKRSEVISKLMKNCGGVGVMGDDPDRVMIGLFDTANKPHVVVTYSPNQHKIGGIEGVGSSTPIKDEYVEYVVDLIHILGAKNFDPMTCKTKMLGLKYMLGNKAKRIARAKSDNIYNEYFKITTNNNNIYYSNADSFVLVSNLRDVLKTVKEKKIKLAYKLKSIFATTFNHYNIPTLRELGLNYIPIHAFTETL